MTDFAADATKFLLTQGWAGILVMAMAWMVWRQSKLLELMAAKLEAAYGKQTELQEKRVSDAITIVSSQKDMSSSMDRLADLIRDRKTTA